MTSLLGHFSRARVRLTQMSCCVDGPKVVVTCGCSTVAQPRHGKSRSLCDWECDFGCGSGYGCDSGSCCDFWKMNSFANGWIRSMQMMICLDCGIGFLSLFVEPSLQQATCFCLHPGQIGFHLVLENGIATSIASLSGSCAAATLVGGVDWENVSGCVSSSQIFCLMMSMESAVGDGRAPAPVGAHLFHEAHNYHHCRGPWVRGGGNRGIVISEQLCHCLSGCRIHRRSIVPDDCRLDRAVGLDGCGPGVEAHCGRGDQIRHAACAHPQPCPVPASKRQQVILRGRISDQPFLA